MVLLIALSVLLVSDVAFGEIVAWVDGEGVRHYTNVREEIPAAYRDSAEVVVRSLPQAEAIEAEEPPRRERERPERRRLAQIVYDRPEPSEEYVRGFADALAYAQHANRRPDINIQGPLALARADASTPYVVVDPYRYDEYPFVTTAFDRGRSRHQTLRMLLQDRFQLGRGWPYVYTTPLFPPRTALEPKQFHPRGSPRRFPRDARVLVR